MKRFLSTFMVISLLLSSLLTAMAAEKVVASTLRLERIMGTVSLTDQHKKELSCQEGMKLLSGHTLSTKAASYAYISLDTTKSVKLDSLSVSTVKKKGKKLELLLSSGKLFFNVTVPLKQDESMEIRTSTMVTGIRGTAGYVEVISENLSRLTLLTGHVTASSYNPLTGQVEPITISAGQSGTFGLLPGIAEPQVKLNRVCERAVPGYVAVEIATDQKLQAQISDQTELDVSTILEKAEETLLQDEAKQQEAQKKADNAQRKQGTHVDIISLFHAAHSSTGGGGGGTPPPPPPPTSIILTNPSVSDIRSALSTYLTVQVQGIVSPDATTPALEVPTGRTFALLSGASMNTDATNSLTINGTALVDAGATLVNSNVAGVGIQVNSSNSLKVAGVLTNDGQLAIGDSSASKTGKLQIQPGGTLTNAASSILTVALGSLENNGTLTNNGALINQADLINTTALINNGTIENHSTLTNSGMINNTVTLKNHATFTNSGTIDVTSGTLNNLAGKLTNSNTINIASGATLASASSLESSGTLSNSGIITRTGGTFLVTESALTGTGLNVSLDCNGSRLYAVSLNDIFANAPNNATLSLIADLPLSAAATVLPDKTLTLNMGAHAITMASGASITNNGTMTLNTGANTIAMESGTSITNTGSMTLNGMAADFTNNITNLSSTNTNPLLNNSGSLTLNNLKLENTGTGEAIVNGNDANAILTLMGDTLVNNATVINNAGTITIKNDAKVTNSATTALEINGGTINLQDTAVIETTSSMAPEALICTGGTINITGGNVRSSTIGAKLLGSSTCTMDGGTISAPNCGVNLMSNSTLTMVKGLIDSTLSTGGIGVAIELDSTFTLNQSDSVSAIVQTLSTATNCAVQNQASKDFIFQKGTVRAKSSAAVCKSLSPDYTYQLDPPDGWHYLKYF